MWSIDRRLPLAALAVLVGACEPGPDAPKLPFDCVLLLQTPTGPMPITPLDPAEIVLGWQGFLWVDVRAHGQTDTPATARALVQITAEGEGPSQNVWNNLPFLPQPDGAFLSRVMDVRLDNTRDASFYAGKVATIAARFTGETHQCVAEAEVTLRDDSTCFDNGQEIECPGDDDSAGDR